MTTPLPCKSPYAPPSFTGDEREWFAALIHQLESRLASRISTETGSLRRELGEVSLRVLSLETCRDGDCGLEELRAEVRADREEARQEHREVLASIERLSTSLHRTREQVAMEVGRRKGERSTWVRPAAIGTGWATVAAGVLALLSRLLGAPAASHTTTTSGPSVDVQQVAGK